jgi:hypothetical protein
VKTASASSCASVVSRGGAEVLRIGVISADDIFAAATGGLEWGNPTGEVAAVDNEEGAS